MLIKREQILKIGIWALILFLTFYSKGANIPNLGDKVLIGPDPYLFYRYTENLYFNRSLLIPDTMRYYPLGYPLDSKPLVAFIGYFFELILNNNIAYSFFKTLYSILYLDLNTNKFDFVIQITPTLLYLISVIVFYFLARILFKEEGKALIATLLFALIPLSSSRIIGGLYEKEGAALPFMLLALAFYLKAKEVENRRKRVALYTLSGIFMGVSSFAWGGWVIIPLVIGFSEIFYSLFRDDIDLEFAAILVAIPLNLCFITLTGRTITLNGAIQVIFSTRFAAIIAPVLYKLLIFGLSKYQKTVSCLLEKLYFIKNEKLGLRLFALFLLILAALPTIYRKLSFVFTNPWTERFASSVEEQQPTFLSYWLNQVGIVGLSLVALYWIIYLFGKSRSKFEKILSVVLPPVALVINVLELHVTATWFSYALILLYFAYLSFRYEYRLELKDYIFLTSFIFFSIADYIVRLLFILVFTLPLIYTDLISRMSNLINIEENKAYRHIALLPIAYGMIVFISYIVNVNYTLPEINTLAFSTFAPYLSAFFTLVLELLAGNSYAVSIFLASFILPVLISIILYKLKSAREIVVGTLVLLIIFLGAKSTAYAYSLFSINYGNSSYQRAWVLLGNIIDILTEKDAVFAHWWDYGYYVQTLGKRATILDGGNAYPYWNHLMGRYVLCGNYSTALEFLYAHTKGKPTYLLIDPTDIGKFYQFSRLGSDLYYDKLSMLGFAKLYVVNQNTLEYSGIDGYGTSIAPIDEDLVFENGVTVPRCVPDLGLVPPRCGTVGKVVLEITKNVTDSPVLVGKDQTLYNLSRVIVMKDKVIVPKSAIIFNTSAIFDAIESASVIGGYVYVYYSPTGNKDDIREYKIPLKCVSLGDKIIYDNPAGWGCLYLVPCSPTDNYNRICAYFITNKSLGYLWIRLYFFNEENPYFEEIYSSGPLTLSSPPWKIWKVHYPKSYSIDSYKECLYLARNLNEINKCTVQYGRQPFSAYWEV